MWQLARLGAARSWPEAARLGRVPVAAEHFLAQVEERALIVEQQVLVAFRARVGRSTMISPCDGDVEGPPTSDAAAGSVQGRCCCCRAATFSSSSRSTSSWGEPMYSISRDPSRDE
jgi:hypothetical protein